MQKFRLVLIGLITFVCHWAISQTTLHIESVPSSTPTGDTLFLAGNINRWNPGHEAFRFEKDNNNEYWLTLDSLGYSIEYKLTRGSWNKVEGNSDGSFFANRTLTLANNDTVQISILSWEDFSNKTKLSTANKQVHIWDSNMYIPQLNRYRRIWLYLPQSYQSSNKTYPVLYMLDGQNIFDESTSFSGEWKVDETLTNLENKGNETAIVVAIDNGGEHRIDEYSPYVNDEYGGGEGHAFLQFIVQTLKPKIDSAYRTKPDAINTGIMGSSMGGLLSHYAYFTFPDVFGKAGVFSPAYWFSDEYFKYSLKQEKQENSRIYLLAGLQEIDSARYALQMQNLFLELGFNNHQLKTKIPADGEHSEWFWAREFEEAFLWLFNND